jgi:hypothetical protein
METSNARKLRVLYLKQFFEERTDAEHPVLMGDIIRYLDKFDVAAEGKSITHDIRMIG